MEMLDGDDQNSFRAKLVENRIWKAVKLASAGVCGEGSPGGWILQNAVQGAPDFRGEFHAQAIPLLFVIRDGFSEIRFGGV